MFVSKIHPRDVSRAKESGLQRAARRFAQRLVIGVWAVLLAGGLQQAVPAMTTEDCVARCEVSVALIRGSLGTGTGFVVAPGLVATNRHVIENEFIQGLQISFPTPHDYPEGPFGCKLVYMSKEWDLAFLAIDAPQPRLPLAETTTLRRGQEVLTIGNPGLGDQIILNALAKGLVSSEFRIEGKLHRQLDINIHPGNSGGPCLDQSGSVVGVVTYKAVGQNGIAFCVPASALQQELARAQKLTARQRAEQASQHLRQTVVTRYATATGCLLKACGLQLGMLVVGVKTELVDASHTLIANADLQRQGLELGLPAVMADKLLPEETKLALIRLAVLHNRAFFAANSPSGTIDEYAAECNSMAEEFAEVVAQLAHQDRPQLARTREEAAR